MTLQNALEQILYGTEITDKMLNLNSFKLDNLQIKSAIPQFPGRSSKIKMSDKQIKFPKAQSLHLKENMAIALNSFANHELLAIEMMASAILNFPHEKDEEKKFKTGLLVALADEQKHFKLYVNRLNELGYEFGDFPLNDFFWEKMKTINTLDSFASVMSLTFESANLDFSLYYSKIFRSVGENKTADILKLVHDDEITHVKLGATYLGARTTESLWEYYLKVLPFPLTPGRSKGIQFNLDSRKAAIPNLEFVNQLSSYQDDFRVTKRKNS